MTEIAAYAIINGPNDPPDLIRDVCLTKIEAEEVIRSWIVGADIIPLYRDPPLTSGRDDSSVLQDDLTDLLKVLGLPFNAQARSPHDIFCEAIKEVRRLKMSNSKPDLMPPFYYQGCQYGEPE